jgi:hypothetical protein
MYYEDHEPPHFHAEHQGQYAKFDMRGELLAGSFKSRAARRMIRRWALRHERELLANWVRLRSGNPLEQIPPLEIEEGRS